MTDFIAYRRTAVRYWEWRRIPYNLLLIPPALLGYILSASVSAGVGDRRGLGFIGVLTLFLASAIGINLCYSVAYAAEFFFGNEDPKSPWRSIWRPFLFALGTSFSVLTSLVGGRNIALLEYSFR